MLGGVLHAGIVVVSADPAFCPRPSAITVELHWRRDLHAGTGGQAGGATTGKGGTALSPAPAHDMPRAVVVFFGRWAASQLRHAHCPREGSAG